MESKLIAQLAKFGFTQNEAKAYITLLQHHPATGYEISQYSGVPRSAIYEILRKLELSGAVYAEGNKPVNYSPIPPDQLATNISSRFEHNIHELKEGFSQLNAPLSGQQTWNIKGYTSMVDHARTMIDGARESIFLSIWNREYNALKVQLNRVEKRGLDICSFSFTPINNAIGSVYSYNIDEEKLRKIWHRQIMLVVDKKNTILGGADNTVDNQSIFSDNRAIVDTCLNYLILDLTLFSQRKNIDVKKDISKMMSAKTDKLNNLLT